MLASSGFAPMSWFRCQPAANHCPAFSAASACRCHHLPSVAASVAAITGYFSFKPRQSSRRAAASMGITSPPSESRCPESIRPAASMSCTGHFAATSVEAQSARAGKGGVIGSPVSESQMRALPFGSSV